MTSLAKGTRQDVEVDGELGLAYSRSHLYSAHTSTPVASVVHVVLAASLWLPERARAMGSCCANGQPMAYWKEYSDRAEEFLPPSSTRARMRPSTSSMTEEQLGEADMDVGAPRRREAARRELDRRGLWASVI